MIHIGIDTVKLDGKGFEVHTKTDASVKKGDLLVEFDKELLEKEGILKEVMSTVMIKIEEHLKHRAGDGLEIGAVMFSKEMGILGKTSDADRLAQKIQNRNKNV